MLGKRLEIFQFCKRESCKAVDFILLFVDTKSKIQDWWIDRKLTNLQFKTLKSDPQMVSKLEKIMNNIHLNIEILIRTSGSTDTNQWQRLQSER